MHPCTFDPQNSPADRPRRLPPPASSDHLAHRFLMLVEGECLQAQQRHPSRPKIRLLPPALLSTPARTSNRAACPLSNPKRPAPNPTTAAPTKSSARSCATAFWIPRPPPRSSPKNCAKPTSRSVCAASSGSSPITACKKKLYALNPKNPPPPVCPPSAPENASACEPADAHSLEREVRQLLADKVSGNLLGMWLAGARTPAPGHLGLAAHLVRARRRPEALAPRLALHLVHEAALCRSDTARRPLPAAPGL